MNPIEVEHNEGERTLSKERKLDIKKTHLAFALGITREKLDEQINEIKGYFESYKQEITHDKPCVGKWKE